MPKVAVLMASRMYAERMSKATAILRELGVDVTERVLSAHRTPLETAEFARQARDLGYMVLICGASQAAHVAGLVAANTTLPVIGVPFSNGGLNGMDALYSTAQMPNGYPVATIRLDGALNAGLLAAQIVALTDAEVQERLDDYRRAIHQKGLDEDAEFIRGTVP